jgi:hypothetical protein
MMTKEERREYDKKWTAENPEKVKAAKRRWREKNRDRIAAEGKAKRAANREKLDAAKRAWEAANPELVSMQRTRRRIKRMNTMVNSGLRYHYSVTLQNYNEILEIQEGVCAICGELRTTSRINRLVVDHDHESGELRGLLCHRCNCGLGYFGDNLANMRRAVAYLEQFQTVDGTWPERARTVMEALTHEGGAASTRRDGRGAGADVRRVLARLSQEGGEANSPAGVEEAVI